jgi:hypothetical protein
MKVKAPESSYPEIDWCRTNTYRYHQISPSSGPIAGGWTSASAPPTGDQAEAFPRVGFSLK